jgi:hypothetical protein
MKVLTVLGKNENDELVEYDIVNPMNLVINKGFIQKPGSVNDAHGQPIPVQEERTFIFIGGKPLLSTETMEAIRGKVEQL